MLKKLITGCLALLAFVALAVVPAIASASPVLKDDAAPNVNVAVGSAIKGFSSNLTVAGAGKSIACTESTLEGELTTNSGTLIEGDLTAATFTGTGGGTCATTGLGTGVTAMINTDESLPWCLKTIGTDEWELIGGLCGGTTHAIRFEAELFVGESFVSKCTYEAAKVTGTYVTNETPQKLHVVTGTFTKKCTGILFPATMALSGDTTLTSAAGTATMIS